VNQRVGSYEIVRVLARGGMAVVYLAHQPALDRDVALKQLDLQTADPSLAQRFVREARLAAGLDHPNVVTLFDFFEAGGVPFIAMEYVGGGSLRPLVGRLSLPQVFGVLEGVLAGLAHAETHGIAHRDLKPENVLITRGGGVKIADFGIARAYNALTPSLTSTGSAIGTPPYMAPEQALDEPLGPHTDLYALGVVAYELLAGRPPFEPGRSAMAVLYCHVNKPPPPLADLAPDAPEPVHGWVEWLLAKQPSERPASAAAAWEALEEIAVAELGPYWRRAAAITAPRDDDPDRTTIVDFGGEPTPIAPAPPPARPRGRRGRAAVAGGAVLALAAGATVWALASSGSEVPNSRPPPAPEPERPPQAAAPYDFDGDGRQELAIALPGSGPSRAGAVVTRGGRRSRPEVIAAADVLRGTVDGSESFGTSVASGDFDGDGLADLAVSAPGRDLVLVLHGARGGIGKGKVEPIEASEIQASGGTDFGSRLLAADFNRDGFSDLVVGAPEGNAVTGSGAIQIVFGGRQHMRTGQPQTILRPDLAWVRFGSKLRAGDVDGDHRVDLVEGAPDDPERGLAGHLSVCRGTPRGLHITCRAVAGAESAGTSALAIADVDGDGRGDIIQGDSVPQFDDPPGGELRIWRGGRRGPTGDPLVISQATRHVPGVDNGGDAFGAGVDAGDLDGDGYADIVVSAPGEDQQQGAITVIRGGRDGIARTGNAGFSRGDGVPGTGVPGEALGWSVAVMNVSGDKRPEVAVAVRGASRIEDAVYVLEHGRGAFGPGETKAWRPLRGVGDVNDLRVRRIRLGRTDEEAA
jgi:predicted Ser/Thr protein kinase